jgi:carbonic anhydrase/acetyltransferase-like protein (isoleucine patch superfamily)
MPLEVDPYVGPPSDCDDGSTVDYWNLMYAAPIPGYVCGPPNECVPFYESKIEYKSTFPDVVGDWSHDALIAENVPNINDRSVTKMQRGYREYVHPYVSIYDRGESITQLSICDVWRTSWLWTSKPRRNTVVEMIDNGEITIPGHNPTSVPADWSTKLISQADGDYINDWMWVMDVPIVPGSGDQYPWDGKYILNPNYETYYTPIFLNHADTPNNKYFDLHLNLDNIRRPAFYGGAIGEVENQTYSIEFTMPALVYTDSEDDPVFRCKYNKRGKRIENYDDKPKGMPLGTPQVDNFSGPGHSRTEKLRGWYIKYNGSLYENPEDVPLIIYQGAMSGEIFLAGDAGSGKIRDKLIRNMAEVGNVLVFDRRGFGISGGLPFMDSNTHAMDIFRIAEALASGSDPETKELLGIKTPTGDKLFGVDARDEIGLPNNAEDVKLIFLGNGFGPFYFDMAAVMNLENDTYTLPSIPAEWGEVYTYNFGKYKIAGIMDLLGIIFSAVSCGPWCDCRKDEAVMRDHFGASWWPDSSTTENMYRFPPYLTFGYTKNHWTSIEGTVMLFNNSRNLKKMIPMEGYDPVFTEYLDTYKSDLLDFVLAAAKMPVKPDHNTLRTTTQEQVCLAYDRVSSDPCPDPGTDPIINPSAQVDPTAYIGNGAGIGPGNVKEHVKIGHSVQIIDGSYIEKHAIIGPCSTLYSATVNQYALVGKMVEIGSNSNIGTYAVIGDYVELGSGVNVEENAIIGDYVTIGKNTNIKHKSVVGFGVSIGNNTEIRENCQIGNHCEIGKNVTINPGSVVPEGTVIPSDTTWPA